MSKEIKNAAAASTCNRANMVTFAPMTDIEATITTPLGPMPIKIKIQQDLSYPADQITAFAAAQTSVMDKLSEVVIGIATAMEQLTSTSDEKRRARREAEKLADEQREERIRKRAYDREVELAKALSSK